MTREPLKLPGFDDRPSKQHVTFTSRLAAGVVLATYSEQDLKAYLSAISLVINRPDEKHRRGYFPFCTIRRLRDREGEDRYHSWPIGEANPNEMGRMSRFDIVVGKEVARFAAEGQHVVYPVSLESVQQTLNDVTENFPEAQIITFGTFV